MNVSIKVLKKVVAGVFTISILTLAVVFQTASQAASIAARDGSGTYKAKCIACHGADGGGATAAGKAMKVRDLRSAEVQKLSDDQLFNVIARGKEKMPAYEKTLGADKCKELAAYVRHLGGK